MAEASSSMKCMHTSFLLSTRLTRLSHTGDWRGEGGGKEGEKGGEGEGEREGERKKRGVLIQQWLGWAKQAKAIGLASPMGFIPLSLVHCTETGSLAEKSCTPWT